MKHQHESHAKRKARKAATRRRWIGTPSPQQNRKVAPGAMPSLAVRKQLRRRTP